MTKLEFVADVSSFNNCFRYLKDEVPLSLLHHFFWISFSIFVLSLPLIFFIFWKILSKKEYRNRFVYRLILFNGITNLLQFVFYILSIHLGIFPSLRSIILSLNHRNFTRLFLFFFMVSISAQSNSSLLISFNRLFSLTHQTSFKNYDRCFYWFSLFSSIFIPLLLSIPILFCDYQYVERRMIKSGESIFRTELDSKNIGPIPVSVYSLITNLLAILSNIAMICILWRENKRKREMNIINKDSVRVEKGLVITTAINGFIHALLYTVAFTTTSLVWIGAGATLILFVALSSIIPFWLLILLVPSLRKELPHLPFPIGFTAIPISFTSSPIPNTRQTQKP